MGRGNHEPRVQGGFSVRKLKYEPCFDVLTSVALNTGPNQAAASSVRVRLYSVLLRISDTWAFVWSSESTSWAAAPSGSSSSPPDSTCATTTDTPAAFTCSSCQLLLPWPGVNSLHGSTKILRTWGRGSRCRPFWLSRTQEAWLT